MTNFWRDKNNKVNSFQVLKYFKFLALYTDLPNIPRVNDKILNKIDKKSNYNIFVKFWFRYRINVFYSFDYLISSKLHV